MKHLTDELIKKIDFNIGKWIKIEAEDYNYIHYLKINKKCESVQVQLVDSNDGSAVIDDIEIKYSCHITEHFSKNGKKKCVDNCSFSNKNGKFVFGKDELIKISFLKEAPLATINKWIKHYEKDLKILRSIQ